MPRNLHLIPEELARAAKRDLSHVARRVSEELRVLRSVSPEEVAGYFIPPGAEAQDHYSEAGNAWAARAIHSALLALGPEVVPITRTEAPNEVADGIAGR